LVRVRELIVSEFVTLDGVMEAPGGEPTHPHAGWVMDFLSREQDQFKLQETLEAGCLLLGRVTYDGFSAAWPQRSGPFADKLNTMPKHVVSSTLRDPEWQNTTVLDGDPVAAVSELKRRDGGPILVAGSRTLVHTLLLNQLVDELRLMVFPVAIGGGIRVFPETSEKLAFDLTRTTPFPTGVVTHTYRARAV
jgi:dihydrofolate reductase